MKKVLPLISLGLCIILLASIVFGIIWFVKVMKEKAGEEQHTTLSVSAYFEQTWPEFCPVYYEEETGCVLLQKQIGCTFEQACQFGKEVYEDLALGHIGTIEVMMTGCSTSCDVTPTDIVISGICSDGNVIYTVHADGTMTACWEEDSN